MAGAVCCTQEHRKVMERKGLTDLLAWKECIREASNPRFDKRICQHIPMGVFIEAVKLMNAWDPERFERMSKTC